MKHIKYLKYFKKNDEIDYKFEINEYVKLKDNFWGKDFYQVKLRYHDSDLNNYKLTYVKDNTRSFWEYESSIRKLTNDEKNELDFYLSIKKYEL